MQGSSRAFGVLVLAVALCGAGRACREALPAEQPEHVGTPDASDPGKVHDCLITPIKLIDVPAQEAGMLVEVRVKENQQVKKGELLAQIDDRQVTAAKNVAEYKVQAAEKEAGNLISVRYATAKNLVAQAAYEKGLDANSRVPGTTPELELQKLKLEVVASKLEIDHSQYQLAIAAINVDVRKAELEAARLDVERRKITAPWDGEVVKREREEGEWVKPGDPVIQLVQMDRLRIEAFLEGMKLSPADVYKRPVTIMVALPHGRQETFAGEITYVSPLLVAGSRFLVKAEVVNRQENGHWLLRPYMKAEMTIQLK